MRINLINTSSGLIPLTDEDYEGKTHLKLGETYTCEVRLSRNLDHHRKYFKMMNTAWSCLPESICLHFKSKEGFRKYCEVTAGYFEPFYSPRLQEWVEVPKSIAFDKMDQAEFEDLYNRVKIVVDAIVTRYISPEEFNELLMGF